MTATCGVTELGNDTCGTPGRYGEAYENGYPMAGLAAVLAAGNGENGVDKTSGDTLDSEGVGGAGAALAGLALLTAGGAIEGV